MDHKQLVKKSPWLSHSSLDQQWFDWNSTKKTLWKKHLWTFHLIVLDLKKNKDNTRNNARSWNWQIIDLQKEILEADLAESDFGAYAMHPDATLEVNDEEIENPFSDYEKYEVPEPEDMFTQVTENKFCFVKVWENSEEWTFKGESDFDLSKLTYEKGKFLYAGEEFGSDGGDGNSSFTAFYRDGIPTWAMTKYDINDFHGIATYEPSDEFPNAWYIIEALKVSTKIYHRI